MAGLSWTPSALEQVNTEVTGTFTLKDNDMSAIYIDWADGESTKKEDANYQWIEITDAPTTVTATHTYSATGTFGPVVQFINSHGFASKYMSSVDHSANIQPFQRNINQDSIVIVDDSATAIMRVENTTVNAGIDNSLMEVEGPADVFICVAPTLSQTELDTIGDIKVEIECLVDVTKYRATASDYIGFGSQNAKVTIPLTIDVTTLGAKQHNLYSILSGATAPLSDATPLFGKVSKIIKVKFISCKSYGRPGVLLPPTDYTTNALYNKLKVFLVAKSAVTGKYYPITYITAGMPIKSVDDKDRFVSLDFSQSRAAASNVALSNYRWDNGKLWNSFSPVDNWALSTNILSTPLTSGNSRKIHYSYLTPAEGINTSGAITGKALFTASDADCLWYTGNTVQDNLIATDDFGRIEDQYYCVRNSVMPASNSGSIITSNQPEVFRIISTPEFTSPSTATETPVDNYTTQLKNNAVDQRVIASAWNNIVPTDMFNDITAPDINSVNQYLLLAFDSPTNKIFLNMANWAQNVMSDAANAEVALKIAGVEYLCVDNQGLNNQHAYWKPLEYKDTTKITTEERRTGGDDDYKTYSASFCKSGYVSYDLPLDWSSISIKDLCGGVYNTAPGTLSEAIAAGNADVIITGTVTNNASVAAYGETTTITAAGTHIYDTMSQLGTAADVGQYKYIGILQSGSSSPQPSGAAYWLASGATDGWNGATDNTSAVTFQYGATGTAYASANWVAPKGGTTVEMRIRRVNIYDVAQGASKVFQDNSTNTVVNSAKIMPVDSQNFAIASRYFANQYNLADADITGSSWATNAKYLLKINIGGSTETNSAANGLPEFQNIFDANQGDSAIIKELDDSAYNLNSLAVTSDVSLSRSGHYFKAITRKGKVYITKTGVQLSSFGLSSVALGDENSSSAFDDHGPSTLYGHLHTMRRIQAENVPVYWDEPQKDGTFVRLFGSVTDLTETRGTNGPRAILNYSFNITIREIALLSTVGELMTDLFPLGGVQNERNYSSG